MDYYSLFSMNAKKAIYRASEICTQFNNQSLEPEHIFYSVLNLHSCSAVEVLHKLGVDLPKLTYSLEAYLYEHSGSFKGQASFSARALALLDSSFKEVRHLQRQEIGTVHLLAALAMDGSPILRKLSAEHNLDPKQIIDTYMAQAAQTQVEYREPGSSLERSSSEFVSLLETAGTFEEITGLDPRLKKFCSRQTRALLTVAYTLARRLRQAELQLLHLLLAALLIPYAPPKSMLEHLGGHTGYLLKLIVERLACGSEPVAQLRLSEAVKDALSHAFRAMLAANEVVIRPAGLLYGMLCTGDASITQLLSEAGIDIATLQSSLQLPSPLAAEPKEAQDPPDAAAAASEN